MLGFSAIAAVNGNAIRSEQNVLAEYSQANMVPYIFWFPDPSVFTPKDLGTELICNMVLRSSMFSFCITVDLAVA